MKYLIILFTLSAWASEPSNMGFCRAGMMEIGIAPSAAKNRCMNLQTDGEGPCLPAALAANYSNPEAVCVPATNLGQGLCYAGALKAGFKASALKSMCGDLEPTDAGFAEGACRAGALRGRLTDFRSPCTGLQ